MKMRRVGIMNKIGVLSRKKEEQNEFQEIFQAWLEQGSELFFITNEEDALKILETQKLQVLFLDGTFYDKRKEFWDARVEHLVIVREAGEKGLSEKFLITRPLQAEKVIPLVTPWLSLEKEKEPLPM